MSKLLRREPSRPTPVPSAFSARTARNVPLALPCFIALLLSACGGEGAALKTTDAQVQRADDEDGQGEPLVAPQRPVDPPPEQPQVPPARAIVSHYLPERRTRM
jgi:hypothetical protein